VKGSGYDVQLLLYYASCVSAACTGAAGSKHEAVYSPEAGTELDDSR